MPANAYSALSNFFFPVRASFSKSFLLSVRSNWVEISDLCFLALYTSVLGMNPLNLTITYCHFFPSSPQYFCPIQWKWLKLLSSNTTFKVFWIYFFTIFAQFLLDSFFLFGTRWILNFYSDHTVQSRLTSLPLNYPVSPNKPPKLQWWNYFIKFCYGFFICSSNLLLYFVIFNPNSLMV